MRNCGYIDTGRMPSDERQRSEGHRSNNVKDCQHNQKRKSRNRLPRTFSECTALLVLDLGLPVFKIMRKNMFVVQRQLTHL